MANRFYRAAFTVNSDRANIVGFDPLALSIFAPFRGKKALLPSIREGFLEGRAGVVIVHEPTSNMVDQWNAMKTAYSKLRGEVPHNKFRGKSVPRTTNSDALAVVAYWNEEAGKADISETERKRWSACVTDVMELATGPSDAPFAASQSLWYDCTSRLVLELDSLGVVPSDFELIVESVKESVKELPGRLGDAIARPAGLIWDKVGSLLLIIGGVIVGGLLLWWGIRGFPTGTMRAL